MKKIRLTESDLIRLVERIIEEQSNPYSNYRDCKPGEQGKLVLSGALFALSGPSGPFCKIISNSSPISPTVQTKPSQSPGPAGNPIPIRPSQSPGPAGGPKSTSQSQSPGPKR